MQAHPIAASLPEARAMRRWIGLAVGSLILAGLLSLMLVIGRAPVFAHLVPDPGFFRRCLVIHVDLSLIVWMYAFVAGLSFLLPGANTSSRLTRSAVFVAMAGVVLMLLAAGATGAAPVLANYVPMIDHWIFGAGLAVFGAGVVASLLDRRLLPGEPARARLIDLPPAAVPALRATAIAVLLAALTFMSSWIHRPVGLEADIFYELLFWGGGHVLQLATTCAMISVWLILVGGLIGRSPIPRKWASNLFAVMLVPWAFAPILPSYGLQDVVGRELFTDLMRWGIFPVASVFLVACVTALLRARRRGDLAEARRDPRLWGFVASVVLCVLGWVLGALISGSTTMIPAHYHAAIGAVTVSFMAVSYPMLEKLGIPMGASRLGRRLLHWQPALFGGGQAVFALGFAVAGAHGAGRKVYGAEQQVTGLAHWLGLSVMALGGLLAIIGGILYLVFVVAAWLRHERAGATRWALPAPEPGGTHG